MKLNQPLTPEPEPKPFPGYGTRLLLMLVVSVVATAGLGPLRARCKLDQLASNAVDLSDHFISTLPPGASAPVVFVGGSEVTPNLPAIFNQDAKGHPAFDLATQGGNILTALAYAMLAQPYHPRTIVLGMIPTDFDISMYYSGVLLRNPDLLRPYLPPDVLDAVDEYASPRLRLALEAALDRRGLEVFPRWTEPWIRLIRNRFYGPVIEAFSDVPDPYFDARMLKESTFYVRHLRHELLHALKRVAEDGRSRFIAYLNPLKPDTPVQARIFSRFSSELGEVLRGEGIPFLDYSDLFANDPGRFLDSVHLTYEGSKLLARRLEGDLAAREATHMGRTPPAPAISAKAPGP